ncbi:MAG: hypothetical protein JKY31_13480 [Rhodobacteraceae bacterium]|nr:hypothetical protein [Paracoccaceae bacterium]
MAYKVLRAFMRDGKKYAVDDPFTASEHDAAPLLLSGLISKPRVDAARKSRAKASGK